jgi:hypothetical protein
LLYKGKRKVSESKVERQKTNDCSQIK